MSEAIVKIRDVHKQFKVGGQDIEILRGISFDINKGDFTVIFGPSGCGKSTLLHGILGLEKPTSGTIEFLGQNLYQTDLEDDRSEFRKQHIGMVYQQPNWIKSLPVIENVAFPLLLLGKNKADAVATAETWLKKVEIVDWSYHMPTELSSGQQQRVALARAMVTDPQVIVADEPTGNLDFESGQKLMQLLAEMCKGGKTVIMVTHDLEYLKYANTAVKILDGKVIGTYTGKSKDSLMDEIQGKRGTHA